MTHLVAQRRGATPPVVDGSRVCDVVASLPDAAVIESAATRLAGLADPTRMLLLACLRSAGELCVRDLAAASGAVESTVSHALGSLRDQGIVGARRQGRLALYRIIDTMVIDLLDVAIGRAPTG